MIDWRRIPEWLVRAWPVLALLPAFVIHWLALQHLGESAAAVNKVVGITLQLIGGLLILYAINDNLGLFRGQSLGSMAIAWFKSVPIKRKPVILRPMVLDNTSLFFSPTVTTSNPPKTVEERVARLEQGLNSLRQEVTEKVALAQRQLLEAKAGFGDRIDSTINQVSDLNKKVEHATVGGFKLQVLGVLLAIYGAVTSIYA